MPKPSKDTQNALNALQGAKTHRGRCAALGLDASWRGTIGRIIYGHPVGLDKENEVRHRLGLPPIAPPLVPVPPCPDCGSVHHARCNGNGGHAVVLAPGETVTKATPKPPRQRRQYYRPCLSDALGRELASAGYTTKLVELALWRALKAEREEEMP